MKRNEYESLILPVILLLTGLILIGGDRVGILSLDQIQNLWPMALILVWMSDSLESSPREQTRSEASIRAETREEARRV